MTDEKPKEIWKPIPGFPDYSASTWGRIRSEARTVLRSNGAPQRIRERVLKPTPNHNGYAQATLFRDKVAYQHLAHRLIALTFHGEPPDDKPEVAHLDHNPQNNRLDNLVYADRIENMAHSVADGRLQACNGSRRGAQKLSIIEAAEAISLLHQGVSHARIAARFGIAEQTVDDIPARRSWREHIMHEAVGEWLTSMDERIAEHRREAMAERRVA